MTITFALTILVLAFAVVFLIVFFSKRVNVDLSPLETRFSVLAEGQERSDRLLREEMAKNREESSSAARQDREELSGAIKNFGDSMAQRHTEMRDEANANRTTHREEIATALKSFGDLQKIGLDGVLEALRTLTGSNESRLDGLRSVVDERLREIQENNAKQLDELRATVDEKLQGTLERRLGDSFKQVSDRLEQVHRGLGEMQMLATGVGDLKRLFANVRARGAWGEIQLDALLADMLTPDQYDKNVETKEGSGERVEFAIKLPGDEVREPLFLPIDAKFPLEDYQRLVEAQEKADPDEIDLAGRQLEKQIRKCAKDINGKYIDPPRTTDFGLMFLPSEALYAEVARRTELLEAVRRECQVVIAGPSTLAATLNAFQMGFRSLAIQKRSSEVWKLLSAVKTEFGRFGDLLDGVKKKLDQASNTMDDAAKRSRAIQRKLRDVEMLPEPDTRALLVEGDVEEMEIVHDAIDDGEPDENF